jgi:hypothetical protein
MSALLDEIIEAATDGKYPLPDILRKCLRLGHELKNERLKAWATQELNGYQDGQDLPEYRTVHGRAKGNFVGPGHMQYKSYVIPSVVLEDRHRHWATTLPLAQSVSAYSDLIKNATTGSFVFPWPGDLLVYYQQRLMQGGFICHSAWQEIPVNALVEVLDAVRNRTLKMALEIKDELGTSYTDLHEMKPHERERIQNIVINAVGGNVALGNIDASGSTVIIAGDRKSLDEALTKVGMDGHDLNELGEAILVDGGSKPGSRVSEWIQSKAGKVVTGGVKVGVSIGQQLLTEFLLKHYGLKK